MTAIFHNEAPYLTEWLEFHRMIGFQHFYLINNLSSDHFLKVLQPYINNGIVDLISWPLDHYSIDDWDVIQCLAYERVLHMVRTEVKWLAILDTDEFLFPVQDQRLIDILSRYEEFGGVVVNWQVFGTSLVPKIPDDQLLIETLHLKLPTTDAANHKIKSIVRPDRVASCQNVHYMTYRPGYFHVNTDRVSFQGASSPYVQIDLLRINHYRARDEYYLHSQKIPRMRKWWNSHSPDTWAALYDTYNQVSDRSIFRFIPTLKTT